MSASKKKMQRRAAVDTGKATQAQAEQAAYKKKARLYTVIGIVVVVLVAALLIWNSGLFQKNATAATVGDENLSVAELGYYYNNNYYRYLYTMYGISEDTIYNSETGATYGDYYMELALSDAQSSLALYRAALQAGYTDADVQDSVAEQISSTRTSASSSGYSYKAYLKASLGQYMTPSLFEQIVTRQLLGELYYNEVSSTNQDSYTAEDLSAYYDEHGDDVDTITFSYLYFKADNDLVEDNTELTDEEKEAMIAENLEAVKATAEEALAAYNSGTPLIKLEGQYDPYMSELDYSVVGVNSLSSIYSDVLLSLGTDEAAVVENEGYGYYLVVFHSRGRNEDLTANIRHILIKAETTTDEDGKTVAPTDEAWAAAETKANEILAEYQSGSLTADAFAALANRYSEDTGSNTTGGLYEGVAATDSYVTEFLGWIFDESGRQPGDTGVVRHEGDTASSGSYWGYHVMYLESWGETEWEQYVRNTLSNEYMTQWYDSLLESYPAALSSGAKYVR